MYVVVQDSRREEGGILFLVNRNIRRQGKWWTKNIKEAMIFNKFDAAEIQKGKLRYNNPRVFSLDEISIIENNEEEEHPFSSYGLGQWLG